MAFLGNIARLFKITYTLASYRLLTPMTESRLLKPFVSFLYAVTPNNSHDTTKGKRLAIALQQLGPSFIKLGQTLSARPDIIGQDIAEELSLLQDKLAPFATDKAIEEIESELSDTIDNLYAEFGKEPVAAASIAQVHKAVTKDGMDVAVKILRPNIEKTFKRDVDFLFWAARIIEFLIPSSRRLKPVSVVEILAESVKIELDLRFEAAAASELCDNSINDHGIYIPSIDWKRTSQRVMTVEWIDGIHIHDTEKLKAAGHNLTDIANKLAVNFFNQAYRDGFFHADMHPGNLFVNAKGDIVPIDFGIMGRLDKKNRLAVAEILEGFLNRNYRKTAQVHIDVGYVPANTSVDLFAQACRSIGEPIVGLSSSKISIAKLLAQLFKITEDFSMETQPQLLLLQKTLVLVEGIGTTLNPSVNMWELAEPWIKDWAIKNIGPEAKIKEHVEEYVQSVTRIPKIIRKAESILDHNAYCINSKKDSYEMANASIMKPWKIWIASALISFGSTLAAIRIFML